MGHLYFLNESLELSHVPEENRDLLFVDFCKAINSANLDKDKFYGTEDIHTIQFSYGNFFYDFLYKSWPEINSNPNLSGISNTAHSLFESLFFSMPGMINIINSHKDFLSSFSGDHYGNTGINSLSKVDNPFISCQLTWQIWKYEWFAKYPNLIDWKDVKNNFLPNKTYSDQILYDEIIKWEKLNEDKNLKNLILKHNDNIGLAFHEEVMRHKGNQIEAYTIEVGRKIAKANYYTFEEELTKNEQRNANSLRNIFSLISNNGEKQYISFDHLHGMFEFHNSKGEHLGEFKFDGSFNSKADVNHNFKTI